MSRTKGDQTPPLGAVWMNVFVQIFTIASLLNMLLFDTCAVADANATCSLKCRCSKEKWIDCSGESLEFLPTISTPVESVNISHNQFKSICNLPLPYKLPLKTLIADYNFVETLTKDCFRNVTTLEWISLAKNKLRRFSKQAFEGLIQLQHLNLNHNKLRRIDWFSFKGLKGLRTLSLERNGLSVINDGAFGTLNNLDTLLLNNNRLLSVSKGWLYGLDRLRTLVLSSNYISKLDARGWSFCPRLSTLDVAQNAIEALEANLFSDLDNLHHLNLSYNLIGAIHEMAFNDLPSLSTLDLSYNKLGEVFMSGQHIFRGLRNLQVLKLNGNELRSLPANVFQGLLRLSHLEVLDNPIVIFAEDAVPPMATTEGILLINSNRVLCNCRSKWLIANLQRREELNTSAMATCGYPDFLAGQRLVEVSIENLTCDDYWPRPRVVQQPQAIEAIQGETVNFTCMAVCKNCDVVIYWSKNDLRVNVRPEDGVFTQAQQNLNDGLWLSTLVIEAVDETDAGLYHCHVINELTMTISDKVLLTVQIPPQFTKRPANVAVPVGDTVRLECAAAGTPMPSISWQKDGGEDFPAARERRMHIMPTDDVFAILPTKRQDSGLYSCIAQSSAGQAKADAEVVILDRKKASPTMADRTVMAGETAVLECEEDAIYTEWFHNGVRLKTERHRFITRQGRMLIIFEASPNDQGIYTCRYKDGFRTARLVVKGAEDASSRKTKVPKESDDDDKSVGEKSSPNFHLTTIITPVVTVLLLCIVVTSSVWLCYMQRCRSAPCVVVAFRQQPLEISTVAAAF